MGLPIGPELELGYCMQFSSTDVMATESTEVIQIQECCRLSYQLGRLTPGIA